MEKKKTKPFQLIVIGVSVALLILAVVVFSNTDQDKDNQSAGVNYGTVNVWGTVPTNQDVAKVFTEFNSINKNKVEANYRYVPVDALDQTLLEALSNDKGPDVLLLPHEWLHRNLPRIAPIPYDPKKGGISEREYKDSFTQGGEIFLYPEGIVALPIVIDPLVMYWNRDLYTNADIVSPPVYWKDILSVTGKLTKKKNLDILQSTIALGEYENVARAKDILSLLFLQIGSPITEVSQAGLQSALGQNPALVQAVRFYVDFANPLKSSYSWNRSLANSQDAFLANELAMYIDLASAYPTLLAKNPRLNFDLAPVPQTEGQPTAVTYGKIHALAVMKKGKNVPGGYVFSKLFSSKRYVDGFAQASGMAPMRRDLLAVPQSDAYRATLYTAALRARSWIDPQPIRSDAIFSRMVESVLSGKVDVEIAVSQANSEMISLINQMK
jgi:multiple sugar transport system substrate-binding protein